jgi:hypothetical protein
VRERERERERERKERDELKVRTVKIQPEIGLMERER